MRRFLHILAGCTMGCTIWIILLTRLPAEATEPAFTAIPTTNPTEVVAEPVDAEAEGGPSLRAAMHTDRTIVLAGRPVWVEFTLTNLGDSPLTLEMPETPPAPADGQAMGLPLEHVFSGTRFTAIEIEDEYGTIFGSHTYMKPARDVAPVTLAPHGSVGRRMELTRHYDALTRPGNYQLVWRPYGGSVTSAPLSISILPEQQAVMVTDAGDMVLRFYYDQAPRHVQNFIELVRMGFYDGLTFHRIVPGGLVQGGDPQRDGRGMRPDGKRLEAEFSDIPFEAGTVGMARLPDDPNSASCQFFICLGRQPAFDGRQTAFARVVGKESFETLRQIAATQTGPKHRPVQPVYIRAVSLDNVPEREREVAWPQPQDRRDRPRRVIRTPDGRRLIAPVERSGSGMNPVGGSSSTRPAESGSSGPSSPQDSQAHTSPSRSH